MVWLKKEGPKINDAPMATAVERITSRMRAGTTHEEGFDTPEINGDRDSPGTRFLSRTDLC